MEKLVIGRGPDAAFWAGKRVFLTGHTGFKGGWLALWLAKLGAQVTGYALAPGTGPSLFGVAQLADDCRHVEGDICDHGELKRAMEEAQPEVVFHLAAQPLVRLSYERPLQTYATNVMGLANILELARRTPSTRAVVVVTSDKCYENRETIWPYRESDPMGGHDPYSSSKGCAELLTGSFFHSFYKGSGRGLASGRAGNVIGGGDWSTDRLIPDLVTAFAGGRAAIIRRPDAVRPWQHVMEPLNGYLLMAETIYEGLDQTAPLSWNFGPPSDEAAAVGILAPRAAAAWGGNAALEICPEPGAVHEATLLTLDATKARLDLAWHPIWDLDRTIAETIGWYRAYYDRADMRRFTLDQIERYGDALTPRN